MLKVFDRAGSVASRVGDAVGVAFRVVPLRRHPGPLRISRLNTWPARTPVNASAAALLPLPHDSGPAWFDTPSPYGSFIHDTLPVCPALSGRSQEFNLTSFSSHYTHQSMPRKSRIDAPGALQHIIGRGIDRNLIFRDDLDRNRFLTDMPVEEIWTAGKHGKTVARAACFASAGR
jgi:hypothetical protein